MENLRGNHDIIIRLSGKCYCIRVQWYYNGGLQEAVTSSHFVQIKTIFLAKRPGFKPRTAGPSQIFRLMLCPLSYWSLGVNNCLINEFMSEFD